VNDNEFDTIVRLMAMDLGPEKMAILREFVDRAGQTCSIEIGTPSKGGTLKVYINPANPTQAAERIKEMVRLRALANDLVNNPPLQDGGAAKL
jgi:hypothetical protein